MKVLRRLKRAYSNSRQTLKDILTPVVKATKSGLQKQVLEKSLDYTSGLEFDAINPDRLLDDKNKNLQLYEVMMTDDRISSIVELKIRLALSVNGEFVSASDDDKDVEISEFVDKMFYGMITKWWDVLYNILEGGIVKGFKVGEKVFDMVDGKIVLRNIKFMNSMFFDFGYSKFGGLDKLYIGRQFGDDTVVEQPDIDNKFIIFTYPYLKNGNYYGESDLREIYIQYYAKYHTFRFRNIYLQKFGQPLIHIIYDQAKTKKNELNDMKDLIENLQDNMYITQPGFRPKDKTGKFSEKLLGKFQIELIETKDVRGTDQYEKTIDQLDRQISRKLLVPDKMGFTADSSGSRNQSEVFFDVLKMVIKDLHGKLEDIVNEIIKQVVDLNFSGVKEYPTWQFEKIDEKIEQEMLKVLIDKGIIDKREAWIRTWTGVPTLSQEEQDEIDEAKKEDRKNAIADAQAMPQPANGFPPNRVPKKGDKAVQGQDRQVQKNGRVTLKTDFKKIESQYDTAEADFVRDYTQIHKSVSENVIRQVERKKIIENKDLTALKTVRVSVRHGRWKNSSTE